MRRLEGGRVLQAVMDWTAQEIARKEPGKREDLLLMVRIFTARLLVQEENQSVE